MSDADRLATLTQWFAPFPSAVVAYSGGVDSALVAFAAHAALGSLAQIVTADSPSVARSDLAQAGELAREFGWNHRTIATAELGRADYAANDARRCYFCKSELYSTLAALAESHPGSVVVSGANLDDLGDYRPGLVAAGEHRVRHPLQELGFTKPMVRAAAKLAGLRAHDRPASPCLASRLATGVAVTAERLSQVERAEAYLAALGFADLRVRLHEGSLARVEVGVGDLTRLASEPLRARLVAELTSLGFRYVTLDLAGFRSGSLNELIPLSVRVSAPSRGVS